MISRVAVAVATVVASIAGGPAGARGEPDVQRPTAAIVVTAPPVPTAEELARLRAQLAPRFRLLDAPASRAVLEGFGRAPAADERVRAALALVAVAHRRFDVAAAAAGLAEARAAAGVLTPSPEGRELYRGLAEREAIQAIMEQDAAAARRAMEIAISVDPDVVLDPDQVSPAVVELADQARKAKQAAPRAAVLVNSDPPGAAVLVGGKHLGVTPLEVPSLAVGIEVIWLVRDGFLPWAERVEVGTQARVDVTLAPVDEEHRLGPLVEALRRSDGERRQATADALGAALAVDAIVAVDGRRPQTPEVFVQARPTLGVDRDRDRPPRRWRRDAVGWTLVGSATAALAAGVTLVVIADRRAEDANRATTIGAYEQAAASARRFRIGGGITIGAGLALATAGAIRFVLGARAAHRAVQVSAAVDADGGVVVLGGVF